MASIFSRIIAGEIPSYKVAETDRYYAFLDINPLTPGHTLCVPKHETDYIFDLPADEYAGLMDFSRKVALALESVVPCKRIGMAVIGMEVPHAHVHLVPINKEADMDFRGKHAEVSPAEMAHIAAAALEAFDKNR